MGNKPPANLSTIYNLPYTQELIQYLQTHSLSSTKATQLFIHYLTSTCDEDHEWSDTDPLTQDETLRYKYLLNLFEQLCQYLDQNVYQQIRPFISGNEASEALMSFLKEDYLIDLTHFTNNRRIHFIIMVKAIRKRYLRLIEESIQVHQCNKVSLAPFYKYISTYESGYPFMQRLFQVYDK
jgi:hypothetical protein